MAIGSAVMAGMSSIGSMFAGSGAAAAAGGGGLLGSLGSFLEVLLLASLMQDCLVQVCKVLVF